MTDAELANLLSDCLLVWGVVGRIVAQEDGIAVHGAGTSCIVRRCGPERRPARWLLATERRAASGRPPEAASSISGLLERLHSALGADAPGPRLAVIEPEWDGPP
ncbi:MAG: hypothetical protein ACREFP_22480 [Acetobacteraceae bacterium]